MGGEAKSFAGSGVLAALLLFAVTVHFASPPRDRGDEWLSWSPEVRTVFADAYLSGYLRGKSDACNAADSLFELDKPVHDIKDTVSNRCFQHAKSYSKAPDYYVKVITDFYQKYPRYRNIPYVYLIFLLTDDWYKTADEIYQAALAGQIRTTF